jgi:hypothetical protein
MSKVLNFLFICVILSCTTFWHYNPSTAMAFNSVEHHDVFVNFFYMLSYSLYKQVTIQFP